MGLFTKDVFRGRHGHHCGCFACTSQRLQADQRAENHQRQNEVAPSGARGHAHVRSPVPHVQGALSSRPAGSW